MTTHSEEDWRNLNSSHNMGNVPNAYAMQIFTCGKGGCGNPHIVLFNKDHEPIAHATVSPRCVRDIAEWLPKN